MPRLIVIKGADEGKQFELSANVISVGREATNPFRLHDTEVSRRHAEFRQTEDGYQLVDVGSANGTYINTDRVSETVLKAGDQINIGQTVLVYSTGASTAAEEQSDLAKQISMISRADVEMSSAIIKTIGEKEGSRLLTQPASAASPSRRSR